MFVALDQSVIGKCGHDCGCHRRDIQMAKLNKFKKKKKKSTNITKRTLKAIGSVLLKFFVHILD